MSRKWQKGYGIDDEGRRTIVITENAPKKTPADRLVELVTHGFGALVAVIAVLGVIVMLIDEAGAGLASFFDGNRWILVVALAIAALYFLGKVSERMRGADGGDSVR